ncbi:hypothetical protein JEM67_23445 [Serratia sp. PAMC26656]|uniref:hypothetical protein n=1 Tax=Serratia sp. PAMC26656 TaxID=2775909 RepID=UPI0018F3F878|nr:hypothetical protein [Serratia sp. PAMC26656]MBJ7893332.1 hypothetical protein [Serratia sp. PAMC26656]
MKIIDSSLLEYVSGGQGNNGGDRTDNGGRGHYGNGTSTNYGGQANGFVSNRAAADQALGQGDCSNGVAAGVLGGLSTGNPVGFGLTVAAGFIGGGCFKDAGNNNSSSKGGSSNCGNGGVGGSCTR